jgi:hypothetical protein
MSFSNDWRPFDPAPGAAVRLPSTSVVASTEGQPQIIEAV